MNSVFKANNPYNNALLILYAVVLKVPLLYNNLPPVQTSSDGILYSWFIQLFLSFSSSFIFGFLHFLLVCILALYINLVVIKSRLFPRSHYLPGMLFILMTSIFPSWFAFSAPLLGLILLIWVWERITTLHTSNRPKSLVFNLGLVVGLASLIYLPFLLFLILVFAGLSISRPFKLHEWIIALIGLLAPYYFLASWLFLSDGYKNFSFPAPRILVPFVPTSTLPVISYILVLGLVMSGIGFIENNMRRQVVQIRRNWQLIYFFSFIGVLSLFINTGKDFSYFIIFVFPFSVIGAATFFYPKKKILPFLFHWVLFALAFVMAYFPAILEKLPR